MKKSLIIIVALFSLGFQQIFAQEITIQDEIGVYENGQFLLKNKQLLITKWEKRLKKEGFNVKITSVEIVTTNDNQIIIVGSNIDKTVKTAISVLKKGDKYYQNTNIYDLTCIGTSNGCYPQLINNDWICNPPQNGNACTKITSTEVL